MSLRCDNRADNDRAWVASRCVFATTTGILLCVSSWAQATDQNLQQRRSRIEAMSTAEREQLRRNHARFMQLDENQRQELRDLHSEITVSPERERLTSVMKLYHRWMQSLTAGERLQIADLPADQRVRAIKKLIERQEREQFQVLVEKSLSAEDREAIFNWLSELAFNRLPPGEQKRLREIDAPLRRRMEVFAVFRRRGGAFNDVRFLERLKPTEADQQNLAEHLSSPAQEMIAAAKDEQEKTRLIQSWVNAAIFSRRGNRPHVTKETLDKFFENLDAAEKDYLNNLPPDRQRDELEQLYMRNRMRRPGDPRAPFAPKGRRRSEEK